ncbi:electron transport complex subunit RsxB [Paludibacterium paludis]|uniref:Rnf electron transport complex subunit B n=2 Tax=Paludibacterium paludis TaxID=1225769 RepID=A0A918NZA0_9NEIS|nr:hypothetical protein GCM10011289_05890 [Paludibacterium paludis]
MSANPSLVARINALLPQTQCGQCGHPGCLPYAEALAQGSEAVNRCPPGGTEGIRALAGLLGVEAIPFDPGGPQPRPRALAVIREDTCIGCTLCIQACPVDAIVGAAKKMHTVIAAECTGCELCIAPCPVDCIDLVPVDDPNDETRERLLARARQAEYRYEYRQRRQARDREEKALRLARRAAVPPAAPRVAAPAAVAPAAADRDEVIRRAMERAREARGAAPAADDKTALIRAAMERAAALRAERDAARTSPKDPE